MNLVIRRAVDYAARLQQAAHASSLYARAERRRCESPHATTLRWLDFLADAALIIRADAHAAARRTRTAPLGTLRRCSRGSMPSADSFASH
jgi:hypothetical protein